MRGRGLLIGRALLPGLLIGCLSAKNELKRTMEGGLISIFKVSQVLSEVKVYDLKF